MRYEVTSRHPVPDLSEGAIGRPAQVLIHAENPEEALLLEMLSNSLFELNRFRQKEERKREERSGDRFCPANDFATITMAEFQRNTPATIHITISNFYDHSPMLWA